MATIAVSRVQRELKEVAKSEEVIQCRMKLEVRNENVLTLLGRIDGPSDTPYEGGSYELEVNIPESYPFHPPKCRFITKIWHPNISSVTGAICLDILKDQWFVDRLIVRAFFFFSLIFFFLSI